MVVNLQSVFSIWAYYFNRDELRMTLRNCTATVPQDEQDFILYCE